MDMDIPLAQPSQLSTHARLLQLVPVPGGSPPPLLSTVLQQAVAERLRGRGREALCEPFAFKLNLLVNNAHWPRGLSQRQPRPPGACAVLQAARY